MKILILGSNGNLGRELVKIFKNNYSLTTWDKDDIDISDRELIIKKAEDLKPDIIINAAAYNAVDKCEADEKEYARAREINGLAVGYLAEAALKINAILVHYSSDYVFPGNKKDGYKESSKPRPINKYGDTKLLGENELLSKSGQGLKWYLIRTSKLFGPKNDSKNAKASFFDIMLKQNEAKNELRVVDEEVSCFTFTPDLALATKELVEAERGYGIYHLTNQNPVTWYEAAKELFKIAGIKAIIIPVKSSDFPRPAKRPKYSVLVNTKLPLLRSYQEALSEYIKLI